MYSSTTKVWTPDNASEHCATCNAAFDFMRRKHHCRACGKLLCEACCPNWLLIPGDKILSAPGVAEDPTVPQRCCTQCAVMYRGQQSDLRERMSKANTTIRFDKGSTEGYMNTPISLKLQTDIRKAAYTLYNFTAQDHNLAEIGKVPRSLLLTAKGIVFLTILKVGMIFTGRVGTGLVIARLEDGTWSAPSAVGLSGMGWGFQIGGELTDVIIVLNTREAVQAFCAKTQVALGTELAVAAGVGISAGGELSGGMKGASAAVSYAFSKGIFVGVSLEASVIAARPDVNRQFYGMEVTPTYLLTGGQPQPKAAEPLYTALNDMLHGTPRNGAFTLHEG